jgi:hypothetical protein
MPPAARLAAGTRAPRAEARLLTRLVELGLEPVRHQRPTLIAFPCEANLSVSVAPLGIDRTALSVTV